MFNFNWGENKSAGIDISDSAIEVVTLAARGKTLKIKSLARQIIPAGVVVGGLIKDEKRLAEIVLKTLANAKPLSMTGETFTFGLPERHFYTHYFVPDETVVTNKLALKELVGEMAEKHVPLPRARQIVSHKIIDDATGKARVLILVADSDAVATWDNFFKSINVKVNAFELETVATWRGIEPSHPRKNICLVDIGARQTFIALFGPSGLYYTFVNQIAGDVLTGAIAKELKLPTPTAEALKIKNGLNGPEAKVGQIIKKELAPLLADMRATFADRSAHAGLPPELIVLAGGSARLPGLAEYFNQEFRLKTILPIIAPILVQAGEHRSLFSSEAHLYLEALGLAMRGIKGERLSRDPYIPIK